MQISLRSHLIAGTAAVVGAGALAINPIMGAQLSLPSIATPSAANVALAGLDSPISELLGTVILGSRYLFDTTPGAVNSSDSWAFANFGAEFGGPPANLPGVIPGILGNATAGPYAAFATDTYSYVGLLPQIIDDALPVIRQLGFNGSNYLGVSAAALGAAGIALSEGVWNAAGEALTLNIPAAISTLISSVQTAGALALGAGNYVLTGVITRATAVVNYLVGELPVLIGGTLAQVTALVNSAVAVVTNTVGAISGGNFEGAFNAVVDGAFGPSGVPGTLLNLTIGQGVQTGAIAAGTPDQIKANVAANFAPSIRTEVQSFVKGMQEAVATPNPAPVPVPVASVRKAARSAASVAAPVAVAAAGDSSAAAADSSAPAEKPAAPRASRKAARAASTN